MHPFVPCHLIRHAQWNFLSKSARRINQHKYSPFIVPLFSNSHSFSSSASDDQGPSNSIHENKDLKKGPANPSKKTNQKGGGAGGQNNKAWKKTTKSRHKRPLTSKYYPTSFSDFEVSSVPYASAFDLGCLIL